MRDDPACFSRSFGVYAALLSFLVFLGTPALLLALADQQVLPWREERAWIHARKQVAPVTPEILARLATARVELERRNESWLEYRVTVWGSGKVDFEGFHGTCVLGRQTVNIDPRLAIDLIADLHVSRFRHFHSSTEMTWVDASTAIVRFDLNGLSHEVEHYLGDEHAPRVLLDMERAIDEVAGSARWLPRREGRERRCVDAGGQRSPITNL